MAITRSYVTNRCGLEQPQGEVDFWWAFSEVEFEEGNSSRGVPVWHTGDGVWNEMSES